MIHSDLYHNIWDTLQKGDSNPENVGKATILPASFTGSKRYMNQYFKDALAICRMLGQPSLFLTMTTNIKWPEIQRMLKFLTGVDVVDAPDVVARVFKMKVDQMVDQIKNKNYFGRLMHVIEFQKRGLPYAHMLIWLHPKDRPKTKYQIDKMVSTEIPDPSIDPVGYKDVKNYMIHGPCGTDCVNSPCMAKGNCTKHFPKRYIFSSEASWRIFGFDIHSRWPSVERLPIHLPNDKHVSFRNSQNLQEVCDNAASKKSKLEAWFDAKKIYPEAKKFHLIRISKQAYLASTTRIKGVISFDDLKTVHGHIHKSFHEACVALVYSPISHPRSLWDTHWGCMSDDIVLVRQHLTNNPNLCLSDYDIQNYAFAEIEKLLNDIGKRLRNFPNMPFPGEAYFFNSENRLILEETSYDTEDIKKIHEKNHSLLNDEQKRVYDSILDNINQKKVVFSSFTGVEVVERLSCGRHYVVDYGTLFTYLSQDSIDYTGDDDNDIRKNSIEYEILCGSHVGTNHLIPGIEMVPSDTNWPFKFKRVQFPIQICYAMIINKSQGQSLVTIGLYLPRATFSHEHIYVAISRVTRPEGLHILIDSDDVLFLMESFDRLSNLDKASTNWKIKDNHVHAFAYHNIWNRFTIKIVEGCVYIFDQFAVKDAVGNLKPVQTNLCIRFTGSNTVRTGPDDGMILL
ncbi:uncharacterized protein LOC141665579 [Apium graveolens]|uniref:uncharacterized protein LOC141665579 n=1 Tax=Apium graveolens TaxID=4045 RepID=UPI003D7AC018